MAKPILLMLDDDQNVLRAIQRDVRNEYGKEYRVMAAETGTAALELLEEFKRRGAAGALFLVDQRMPEMTGVEFLEKAVKLFPEAKRVLLTAYADTDAAIKAINDVHIDHYLLKPWDPPEEKLYPVLSDLLDEWRVAYKPPFEGIRVVGSQWDPASNRIKDFLARNDVAYLWLDVEASDDARRLVSASAKEKLRLPTLFFPDGTVLQNPENREIADQVGGMQTTAERPFYDFVVVGGGPAGLAAAVYGASEGLRTLVVEREAPGGQAGTSSLIENYLGFPNGLSGGELSRRAVLQAKRFGVEILTAQEVIGLEAEGPSKVVKLGDGTDISCRSLLISTGVSYRRLEAEGVDELAGAGVYYGSPMGASESLKDQDIYIVGAANSAGQAAIHIAGFASSVTLLVRGDSLTKGMSDYLIKRIETTDNIRVLTRTQIAKAEGSDRLERLVLACDGGERTETVQSSGLCIFIGAVPHTSWVGDAVNRDEHGFILSGPEAVSNGLSDGFKHQKRSPFMLETSVPGVFVAGDVRHASVKRVASAVGEGSMAVMYVHRYLSLA